MLDSRAARVAEGVLGPSSQENTRRTRYRVSPAKLQSVSAPLRDYFNQPAPDAHAFSKATVFYPQRQLVATLVLSPPPGFR